MDEKHEERQAVIAIAAVLAITLFAAVFFQQIKDLAFHKTPPEQTAEYCESQGAAYLSFTNSCRDSCDYARKKVASCSTVLTTGCDCGPDKCWDGFECTPN